MSTGSKQIIKTQKSKFKKNQDRETLKQFKKKHHDKTTYRLARNEDKDYVD
jgi:hypothetical protein